QGARAQNLHLVLLWFGAWKNSQSSYAPSWVKRDQARFPRIQLADGEAEELLSPLAPATLAADRQAFAALLDHLRQVDTSRTVLMVQVENEIGMIPQARDHSPAADAALAGPAPNRLLAYLAQHRPDLTPEIRGAWEAHGARMAGTWRDVFGDSVQTDEIFTAWTFAAYVEQVAEAGKAAYPLPMYVNAALIRPGRTPGRYPSGGPLPHLIDIWKAGAPRIDMLSPDLYFANFGAWTRPYARSDNPLFVPEAENAGSQRALANALFAFGALKAVGFSPFSVDTPPPGQLTELQSLYAVLADIAPQLLQAQASGEVIGFESPASYDGVPVYEPQIFQMGDVEIEVSFAGAGGGAGAVAAPGAPGDTPEPASAAKPVYGGLVIRLGPRDFLVAGKGVTVAFRKPPGRAPGKLGIDSLTEGWFQGGGWTMTRRLNGDQSNQGRFLRMDPDKVSLQRVTLYDYQ
ncbi:MAG: GH35 family beta-galactosidase, partial [Caulobacteraceae bacterium]